MVQPAHVGAEGKGGGHVERGAPSVLVCWHSIDPRARVARCVYCGPLVDEAVDVCETGLL